VVKINDVADRALLSSDALPPRVLVIEAKAHSSIRDIAKAAASVAEECRRLRWEGYDLRHVSCKAIMLRNDSDYAEPGPHRPEHVLRTKRR